MIDAVQSSAFSLDDLLPHLGRLRYQLGPDLEADPWQHLRAARVLEQLPYCLGAAAHSFFELSRLQWEIVERVAKMARPNTITEVALLERNLLGYSVDFFLDASRRAQNALIPYVSRKLSLSLPESLDKIVKQLREKRLSLPETLDETIQSYWEQHGKSLKDYRDLAQHFAIVSSEALNN